MMMKMKAGALALAIAGTLAGCSTMVEIREGARTTHDSDSRRAEQLLEARRAREAPTPVGPIVTDTPFVDVRPMGKATRYPPSFRRVLTFNEPAGLPLQVLAQRVEAMTGVRLKYQSELVVGNGAGNALAVPNAAGGEVDATLRGLPPISQAINAMQLGGVASADVKTGVAISYSGDVTGLFNAIAASTGSHWEYDDASRTVNLFRYKTQVFEIPIGQGIGQASFTMGGLTQSSGSGGSPMSQATAESSHKIEMNAWAGIENAVKQLVSPEGAYAINQTAGTLLVRDRPDRMELIEKYVNDTMATLSRQVDLEVNIYRVTVNDRDVRGLNLDAVFSRLIETSGYNIGLRTQRPDVAGGGLSSLVLNVPERDANGVPNRYGGTSVFYDALSTLGRTSVVTNSSVSTRNNMPVPIKVVRRTSYLAEASPGFAGGGSNPISSGPQLTPGMVETGLNMFLLPQVTADGKRVALKMMASLSTLERLDSFGNDQVKIQQPQTTAREFSNEAWLSSGETWVVAGFQQTDSGMDTSTPIDNALWLLGGKSEARKGRELIVIAIRPTVKALRSRI